MPNLPEPYALGSNIPAFPVAEDTERLRLIFNDVHFRFSYNYDLKAPARGSNREPLSRLLGPDFLDQADIPNRPLSWRSYLSAFGGGKPATNVVLYNPTGWGREIELMIEGDQRCRE